MITQLHQLCNWLTECTQIVVCSVISTEVPRALEYSDFPQTFYPKTTADSSPKRREKVPLHELEMEDKPCYARYAVCSHNGAPCLPKKGGLILLETRSLWFLGNCNRSIGECQMQQPWLLSLCYRGFLVK